MMISITYRITGLMFMLISVTVFLLVYLANHQMAHLFEDYLVQLENHIVARQGIGVPEVEFLESVHQSLKWVGAGIMVVGLAASYALAHSITVPLRKLNSAVQAITRGNYSQRVHIESGDEVQQLASAYNSMADALATNNHLRKRLLADIAHELRTPLAIIKGNLEGMLDGVIATDKEQLTSLHEETVHLTRLICDLRDLSLAEAGQLVMDKSITDLKPLVFRSVHMLKPLANEKGIELESSLGEIPPVELDASRLNQVVYNLLTNAIRYTPSEGKIFVALELVSMEGIDWIKLRVCDTGRGISAEDLPYIFDHFYRADKDRDRKSGGSGIGLSIVRTLVESHGGRVEVESRLGQGSCFIVFLPVNKS